MTVTAAHPLPHSALVRGFSLIELCFRFDVTNTFFSPTTSSLDAAKIIGSIDKPPGFIFRDTETGINSVVYEGLPGVHGIDQFGYISTDCLAYGEQSVITIKLAEPELAFTELPYLSFTSLDTAITLLS